MNETQEITALLHRYEQALNDSNIEALVKLYTADAVLMPQNAPSTLGVDAIRHLYQHVFGAIRLTVKFAIQEVHAVAPQWAFARTNSAGTMLVNATGKTSSEANQELFVLQKVDGEWKIARYCYSTTNPPRA